MSRFMRDIAPGLLSRIIKGKRQIENGDGYASGGTVLKADGEESHGGVPEDSLRTVPLARNRPRPLIDVYY